MFQLESWVKRSHLCLEKILAYYVRLYVRLMFKTCTMAFDNPRDTVIECYVWLRLVTPSHPLTFYEQTIYIVFRHYCVLVGLIVTS